MNLKLAFVQYYTDQWIEWIDFGASVATPVVTLVVTPHSSSSPRFPPRTLVSSHSVS